MNEKTTSLRALCLTALLVALCAFSVVLASGVWNTTKTFGVAELQDSEQVPDAATDGDSSDQDDPLSCHTLPFLLVDLPVRHDFSDRTSRTTTAEGHYSARGPPAYS